MSIYFTKPLLAKTLPPFLNGIHGPISTELVEKEMKSLMEEASQDNNSSYAPFSRLWGTTIGTLLGAPTTWGNFAATQSRITNKVRSWTNLRAGGRGSVVVQDLKPGQTTPFRSNYDKALKNYIDPIIPAVAAELVNETSDDKITKKRYETYQLVSNAVSCVGMLGLLGLMTYAKMALNRR